MKRVGYITDKDGRRITLLEAMGDYGNVQKAYNKARKCKRHRKDVLIFTKDKEENLDKVREDIINLAYEPSKYHYFKVYEPKERQIMALPFYDRVVQHAINNVLEPIFDKRFISQSYACRKGKGMHAASDTLKEWLYEWNKYHPDQPLYAIKADIHHYFQSIDHAVLKTEIRKVIKDAGVLALLDRIIDHNGNMPDGVGIPVGNLTSQLFANIYLDALDQFIKHELGVEAYIRYMDDFVILSPDKEQLRNWLARIEQFLRELRIIQSIPSPKAEPFKLWLAQVGRERIEETIDPELTIDRALETYLKKGYSREWINQRLQAIQVRKELTDEWDARGVQKGVEYAILTDEISRAWSGMSTRQYKNLKGLKKENLRDNMTTLELVLNMLAEATTTQFSRDRKPTTFQENLAVAKAGGQVAGRTRKDIESQSDTPVITAKNAAQLNQVVTDLLEGAVSDTTEESKDK